MAYGGKETPQMALDRAIRAGVVKERRDKTFYCNVCDRTLKSKDTMKAHLRTSLHSANSTDYDCANWKATVQLQNVMPKEPPHKSTSVRSRQDNSKGSMTNDDLQRAIRLGVVIEPRDSGDSYYCSSCKKFLRTKQTMRAHLSTQTHLSKADVRNADPQRAIKASQQFLTSAGPQKQVAKLAAEGNRRVDIADNSRPGSSRHGGSASPVEKAIANGILVELGADNDSNGSFWCSVCNQTLKVLGKLDAHLSSKKHNEKLTKMSQSAGEKDNGGRDDETSDSSGSDSYGSYSTGSDSCDDEVGFDADKRLVWKAIRDGILQNDASTNHMYPYWCNVCMQPLKHYGKLAGHLHSYRHRAKVEVSCPVPQQEQNWKVSLSKFEYSNNYPSKGRVFVFNVLKDRPGAEADTENIRETFQRLGYEVFIHEDFTKERLYSKVEKIKRDSTLKEVGALILFILSHGQDIETFLCSDDQTANLGDIMRNFTHSNCPILKGKPKIFFANFCRGRDIEIHMHDEQSMKLEALVDTVVVHASNEGMKALRSKATGTVFVQSLCKVLSSTDISKQFRKVYYCLHLEMASKRGTTPMLKDYVFKEFTF